ncbi:hypothetical protein Poli38472_000151 [Pythium oligandrum]|uniref:Diphthine--ammonia ligase n=1 Tax=Pythium oligandrum TaxID=41045 RepID=A0A8K1CBQ6_PYTOL|nr:hypothetical protein Poli38472_000151 [Pythium oligandrum]|eukprot:TMW60109.1 hypothetical protein Poli38472_000151 [Pythium oligandrum]
MKVVALVSGGKDSCYAMMECVRHGHELVSLAHLHPPLHLAPEEAEIDSFMYQSVGHNVVRLIAESMELPLVTETITGTAIKTDIDYATTTEGDEVEDLYRLLQKVATQFPDVQGVCSGAIFSSYQRNRVENVCARLGLTSLGYLWRRDQEELLDEMIESGIEAILVKVAAIGLQPRRHLGRTIGDLQMDLLGLQEKYQLNVCGEGGEYETLTLDCPLFKKRIVVDSSRTVLHSDDFFAPVAFLVVEQCHLEDKDEAVDASVLQRSLPPLFTPVATEITSPLVTPRTLAFDENPERALLPSIGSFRDQFYVSGIMSTKSAELTLEEEMQDVLEQVKRTLAEQQMTLDDVCFVHLYVRDMNDFARINAEYCQHIPQYMPASRSCVELRSLPSRVLMDCFALRGSGVTKLEKPRVQRDVLHIQSISAWAPNCIGPYSQANILHKSLILLAGQVAFQPETMQITGKDHVEQTKQCLRNAGRVFEALESNLRHVVSGVAYVVAPGDEEEALKRTMQTCHEQLITNADLRDEFENVPDSGESDNGVEEEELDHAALARNTPLLAVALSHLPRHALVEVELQSLTHRAFTHTHPRSSTLPPKEAIGWRIQTQTSSIPRAMSLVMSTAEALAGNTSTPVPTTELETLCTMLMQHVDDALMAADLPWDRLFHLRVFYRPQTFPSELEIANALSRVLARGIDAGDLRLPALTFVPVEAIHPNAQLAIQATAQDLDKLETDLWLQKQV